jgi:hypothetical protein
VARVPSGARPESGNWVIPNELGNELGNNIRGARQLMAPTDKHVKICHVKSIGSVLA